MTDEQRLAQLEKLIKEWRWDADYRVRPFAEKILATLKE